MTISENDKWVEDMLHHAGTFKLPDRTREEIEDALRAQSRQSRKPRVWPSNRIIPVFAVIVPLILAVGGLYIARLKFLPTVQVTGATASSSQPYLVSQDSWYTVGSYSLRMTKGAFAKELVNGKASLAPPKNQKWLTAEVTIKNISASPLMISADMFAANYNDVQENYRQVRYPVSVIGNDFIGANSLIGKHLKPGQSASGEIVFAIPSFIHWDITLRARDPQANGAPVLFMGLS